MSSRFAIVNPCPKRWADLQGDGRQRHCDVCRTSVHAVEQYSREEWDQVWRESDGHVCGLLSGESPPEPRSRRGLLVGALLTAISPLMAQTGRVRIRVIDANGAMVVTAEASLLGSDKKPKRTVRANEVGEIAWTDLPLGNCQFTVMAPGFKARSLPVTLRNGDEVKIEVSLEVGAVGEVVMIETTPTPESKRTRRRR